MHPIAFTFQDVNEAYSELQIVQKHYTKAEDTRNGMAWTFQMPVIVEHASPYRRVLFDPKRNANPFFHYMEAIWMLSGSDEVSFLEQFVPRMKSYSDDGIRLNGAYGYRWRHQFDRDQLSDVIHMIQRDRGSRRAVISMWDATYDLGRESKDLPCNTHIYFRVIADELEMTVCNRSNDMVWGMLGANMVHMSILMEYIARAVNLRMGSYYQFTNNLHIYDGWEKEEKWTRYPSKWYYENPGLVRWTFGPDNLKLSEAERFVDMELNTTEPYKCRIIRDNAVPMLRAHQAYKEGDLNKALDLTRVIYDDDWREACFLWIKRKAKEKKNV